MENESYDQEVTVLVTGFGPFLDIKENPSWQIASKLPSIIEHRGINIRVIVPPTPLDAEYHHLIDAAPALIKQHQPHAVIHMGTAVDRNYFAIEKGAFRDGYHQYPDMARKVVTKVETKKLWGNSPERLDTALDLDEVLRSWKGIMSKEKGKGPDLRTSDDVGSYVCGLVYYASLESLWKRGNERTKVVFFHIPPLKGLKDLEMGGKITTALIGAVSESGEL